MRRAGFVVGVVMAVVVGMGVGPAAAANKPVVGDAEVFCSWTKGTVRFAPPLVDGGTTPAKVTFKGTMECESHNPDVPVLPYGLTGGKVTGSFTIPHNVCGFTHVLAEDGGPGTATIKWQASQKLVPTKIDDPQINYRFGLDSGFGFSNVGGSDFSPATGSFAGEASGPGAIDNFGAGIETDQPASTCGPKVKGVPGSGKGIRKLPLAIDGPAFEN